MRSNIGGLLYGRHMGALQELFDEWRESRTLRGRFREVVSPRMREVSHRDYGEAWPLTVEAGTLRYEPPGRAVFEHDGTAYALNGLASSAGYADIDPIWADREGFEDLGLKVNISPLLDDALALKDSG